MLLTSGPFLQPIIFYVYVCFACMYICAWCLWSPEEDVESLELVIQTVVNHLWVLGMEPKSSVRATNAINH